MKGFIIYPTYTIENDKAYVLLYGRLENGKSFLTKNYTRPYFYIESSKLKKAKKLEKFDYEETKFKNFKGDLLTKVILNLPRDVPPLRQKLEKENIECYEADIRFAYRFMIDNDLQGTIDISGKNEKHEYVDFFFDEPELKPSGYIPKLKTLSIDIETSMDSKKLYSIAMYSKNYEKTFIVHDKKLSGAFTGDEKAVLEEFKKEFLVFDPDIITGWSIIDFDLDYLNKKFSEHKIPFTLGRSSEKCKLSIESNFFKTSKADFQGRQVLDSLSLIRDPYLKDSPYIRSKKFENYRLETVAKEILGKSKLIDNTKNKGEEIDRLYKEDKKALLKYNLNDAVLTYEILEETKLIDLLIERSILTGMPLDRVNASIASLDSLYIREARKRKLVVPSAKFTEKKHPITGGYVMQSKPGIYENILVFDFKSLYPSIMMTFNIDPSSYLEKKEKNCIETQNKAYFKNTEGILPSILEKLMEARAKAKKEKRDLSSQAIKITMNTMFGSMASSASRFFNMKIANSITTFGQYFIKSTAEKIQEEGYDVIYSDTDSVFINSRLDSSEKAEKIGKEIEVKLNSFYKRYIKEEYNRDSKLELEFEKNYTRFLMPKIRGGEKGAKKRYAGLLIDGNKEKIDIVGMEFARSDWTGLSKKFQLEMLDRIFHKKEVSDFIKKFVEDLKTGKYDDLLVYKKSLRKGIGGYQVESQHLKAAKKLKTITSNLIEYVITIDGPEPIQNQKHKIDYDHYIDKQIKPIADSVLCFYNTSFDELLSKQHSLFDFKN